MKLSELKSGMIVDHRDGHSSVVVENGWQGATALLNDDSCHTLTYFTEDMRSDFEAGQDIMRVYGTNGGWGLGFEHNLRNAGHFGRTLLWERPSLEDDELKSKELFGG